MKGEQENSNLENPILAQVCRSVHLPEEREREREVEIYEIESHNVTSHSEREWPGSVKMFSARISISLLVMYHLVGRNYGWLTPISTEVRSTRRRQLLRQYFSSSCISRA